MPRTGEEEKPYWNVVPPLLRQQVGNVLGAPVVRAMRVWGGYAPTPTFRLQLADGRRAFFKGVNQASNSYMQNALVTEERIYKEISSYLGEYAPKFYASLRYADWHCLLLEDVGSKTVPPWTPRKAKEITKAIAAFHQLSVGFNPPTWISRPIESLAIENLADTQNSLCNSSEIFKIMGDAEALQVLVWLEDVSSIIEDLTAHSILKTEPFCILHGDLRSDNLRFNQNRLCLFDWPSITVGRPEWEMAVFAQSVAIEAGPMPEQILYWYKAESNLLDETAIHSAIAWWITFFLNRAWQPEIHGLPRLRRFQRQQLGTLILWLARQGLLPAAPQWVHKLLL